jgi:hypothetical protein
MMQMKTAGKMHEPGNMMCASCDQTGMNGRELVAGRHYPYRHQSNPPCTGLVHAELFTDEDNPRVIYRCDTCGGIE